MYSTRSANIDELMLRMKWLSRQMPEHPTSYVMTHKTFSQFRESIGEAESDGSDDNNRVLNPITGIPIEWYLTMRECMDRMVEKKDSERLMLVAPPEELSLDLFDHPYMEQMKDEIFRKHSL